MRTEMTTPIGSLYYKWITDSLSRVGITDFKLFEYLDSIPFDFYVALDENRVSDGVSMRYKFLQYNNVDISTFKDFQSSFDGKHCSVLEVLFGLAFRIESDVYRTASVYDGNIYPSFWFWTMMTNLQLQDINDINFDENFEKVVSTINVMLKRQYNPNGTNGGLFYTIKTHVDLRKVDIWYQVNWFISEQYIG